MMKGECNPLTITTSAFDVPQEQEILLECWPDALPRTPQHNDTSRGTLPAGVQTRSFDGAGRGAGLGVA